MAAGAGAGVDCALKRGVEWLDVCREIAVIACCCRELMTVA
jgi:hypothetical protein